MEAGNESTKLIGTLVLLIVVFGLVAFGVFIFTTFKGKSEAKLDELTSMLDSAELAEFSAYDNQVVSGANIQSVANLYKGREYMVAVITAGGSNNFYSQDAGTILNGTQYYYNAIPDGITSNNGVYSGTAVSQEEGLYVIDALQRDEDTGLTVQNSNYAPMARKTDPETYVKSNGRYYANLVVDSNGEMVGFIFQQMQ